MMSSVLYLEQFLESLEPLPAELKKNFNDMREMDEKVELQKGLAQSMGEVIFKLKLFFNKIIKGLQPGSEEPDRWRAKVQVQSGRESLGNGTQDARGETCNGDTNVRNGGSTHSAPRQRS